MNNISARNVVIIVAAVVIGLVVLGFVGTILSNIVPIAIVAVLAYLAGRMSHKYNYLEMGKDAAKRLGTAANTAANAAADQAAKRAVTRQQAAGYDKTAQVANEQMATEAQTAAEVAAKKAEEQVAQAEPRLAEPENIPAAPSIEIKTIEQIQAESRLVEQEAAKKAQTMDVQAALEERKRRLLGDKPE